MILIDTNLWLYATLEELPQHRVASPWLEATLNGTEAVPLPWSVVLGAVRISTQPRLLQQPLRSEQALALVDGWLGLAVVEPINPGPRHWPLLQLLIQETGTAGNLTADAHLAALAIEHDCTLFPADNDFRRFSGLRFCDPLQ